VTLHGHGPRRRHVDSPRASGQATVELALLLPVVVLLVLVVVQVAVVVRAQVLVVHAAREAARAAAVDDRPGAAAEAARRSGLADGDRLRVDVSPRAGPGSQVRVEVRDRVRTDVPLIGPLVGDVDLRADASMRVER